MISERYLTLPETAELLRTPEGTLRYWRHMGDGPKSFKLGRRVVYAETAIESWLKEREAADEGRRQEGVPDSPPTSAREQSE